MTEIPFWTQQHMTKLKSTVCTMLLTTLRSAEFTKIGLSSPQTKRDYMCFGRSAILCCCVVLGLLVLKSVVLDLARCVSLMFCLENTHHIIWSFEPDLSLEIQS